MENNLQILGVLNLTRELNLKRAGVESLTVEPI